MLHAAYLFTWESDSSAFCPDKGFVTRTHMQAQSLRRTFGLLAWRQKGVLHAFPLAGLARVQWLTLLLACHVRSRFCSSRSLPCKQASYTSACQVHLLPLASSDALQEGASACTASAAVTAYDLVQKNAHVLSSLWPHSAPAFALCCFQLCLCRPKFRTLWLAALTT